jgi:hypothetical protein
MKLGSVSRLSRCILLLDLALSAGQNATTPRVSTTSTVDPSIAQAARRFISTGCDESLWEHVYHSSRLKVIQKCVSVTGTIHHVKKEADGDDHIQFQLDHELEPLLNDRNKTAQAGSLVLEPICQNPPSQPDATEPCRDFHSAAEIPLQRQPRQSRRLICARRRPAKPRLDGNSSGDINGNHSVMGTIAISATERNSALQQSTETFGRAKGDTSSQLIDESYGQVFDSFTLWDQDIRGSTGITYDLDSTFAGLKPRTQNRGT